ncbi:hypothetical protein GLAREA_11311 [Glarea lozoyensis ATCC 20868]|uniref:YMC020W-like alpha/beta hydrolase domain-containing protein n=1 Tax=Glarea lozoyensis (strain ATCC 20868 / MF5171) TaxID=1116229 RepID=S3DUH0_GLAL2|nr:uncharacterized protein GLAREA_11311 [Glarea lozoyensis ATCC 20868]EPE35611.1 hypothetical protein GLAREA_11311 [Glarea lozoyensis ATCC 20868]
MGPLRKRSKPNPAKTSTLGAAITDDQPSTIPSKVDSEPPKTEEEQRNPGSTSGNAEENAGSKVDPSPAVKKLQSNSTKEIKHKSSWYGTWPRKSTASTQLARETILADKPKNDKPKSTTPAADLSRFETKKPSTPNIDRPPAMRIGKSRETLELNMGERLGETKKSEKEDKISKDSKKPQESKDAAESVPLPTPSNDESVPTNITMNQEVPPTKESDPALRPTTASGWFGGWLGGPQPKIQEVEPVVEPLKPVEQPKEPTLEVAAENAPDSNAVSAQSDPAAASSSSWFGLWSASAPAQNSVAESSAKVEPDGDTIMEDVGDVKPATKPVAQPAPSGSWVFWSSETTKKSIVDPGASEEAGQISVAGESSESQPKPFNLVEPQQAVKASSIKRSRPQSVEIGERVKQSVQPSSGASTPNSATIKTQPANLFIPSLRDTYRMAESPTFLQQLARLLSLSQQSPPKHLYIAKQPPRIKHAIAIGVHGLFPATYLRKLVGQPTGTSLRFANHAADSVRRWADANGSSDVEINKVVLEAEGKIIERVEKLWPILLNNIDKLRKADFIMVGCHSQGVPVAIMLIAKLIEFGVISTSRIGFCAMAGVSLGPFPNYKSSFISGAAGELFEFADSESPISKRLDDSLRKIVKYGAKITFVASIDDQLVSMESAIFSVASHPHIYRAVFVDGRIHAPDFISHLVGFAMKLRNLGVSDHGLIRELSVPLAGSLYSGEGHSRLYDETKLYDCAISHALETTDASDIPLELKKYEVPSTANPYVLPWIMRGLLEEEFVKNELNSETHELLKQFDDWKPSTKVLKDVKYRLEAVRSKL